jgi:hypothetical protein
MYRNVVRYNLYTKDNWTAGVGGGGQDVSSWNKMAIRHWTSRWPSAMSRQFVFRRNGSPRTHVVNRKSKSFECIHTTLESVGGLRVHFTFVRRCPAAPCGHSRRTHGIGVVSLSLSLYRIWLLLFLLDLAIVWSLFGRSDQVDTIVNATRKQNVPQCRTFVKRNNKNLCFFFPPGGRE